MEFAVNSSSMRRYYSILGIEPGSTFEDIRSAYRKSAKAVHPDIGGDPIAFRDIKEAYEILSDPIRRKEYDSRLAGLPFGGEPYKTVEAAILSEPVDVFDDIVDVVSRRLGMEKRSKIKVRISISESDSNDGVNLEIAIPIEMICQRCFGFGGTLISTCKECGGKGMILGNKNAYLRIKPGAASGDSIIGRSGKTMIEGIIKIER